MYRKYWLHIAIANITAIVCFAILGLLLCYLAAFIIISYFGLLNDTTKNETIITSILFILIAVVNAFIATKAGLYFIKK